MENKDNITQITAVSAYSGPLPPPEALSKYNEAAPNAADRIIAIIPTLHANILSNP